MQNGERQTDNVYLGPMFTHKHISFKTGLNGSTANSICLKVKERETKMHKKLLGNLAASMYRGQVSSEKGHNMEGDKNF